MEVSYNLSLLLRKHVKILKVHDRKISCSVGGFWFLVLDLLHVVLSLVFIVGALERQSRLDKTCMVESNQGKHGWV